VNTLVYAANKCIFRIKGEDGEVSQEKLDELIPNLRVLARAQPKDKYVLVQGIIESRVNR
jgi:hypothetical protein